MKVRWNSCYAISNILKEPTIYSGNSARLDSVFNALFDLVVNFRNFKVRINAALALASPRTRVLYGHYYYNAWKTLLKALENSQEMEDFTEYKHRDNLVEQICITIGYLTTLLTVEDLNSIKEFVLFHYDVLMLHMHRVLERVLPEKSTMLVAASGHIKELLTKQNLTVEQQELLGSLNCVFNVTI